MDLQQCQNFDNFRKCILPHDYHPAILSCGSFNEQPLEYAMLNLTDLDHMFFDRKLIATTETAIIPKSFHGEILTLETENCHVGFARLLRRRGGKIDYFILSHKSLYGPARPAVKKRLLTAGPEVCNVFSNVQQSAPNFRPFEEFTADVVTSVLCPHWPSEADEWRTRERCRGWPTRDMIEKIVAGGCHLVPKSHENDPNDDASWRFSFSMAELISVNSWNEVQKYIYHILRLLKSDVIAKCGGEKKTFLCTYHFKTLMLWACEEKPSDFWNEDRIESAVEELLLQMIEWIIDKNCPNYFIRGNNRLDYLQSEVDVSNEVLLLHDAIQTIHTVIAREPMVYRGKMLHVLVSDKAILLCQLAINRRYFINIMYENRERFVVNDLSSSALLRNEVEHLFTGIQLHCFLMSDLFFSSEKRRCERRKTYESDALSYFKISCKRKGANSYSDVYISLFDSLPIAVSRFLYETPCVHKQRMCCYRRTDEGNLTKEAMEVLCQSIISTANDNHQNASYFISAAYYANFCYTGLRDYQQVLTICEEGLASLDSLRNVFSLNTFDDAFSNEILCMFINRQYIHIFDSGIQVLFGFLTLYVAAIGQNERAALDPRLFDRDLVILQTDVFGDRHFVLRPNFGAKMAKDKTRQDLVIQVCAEEFLEYIRFRCRNKLHLSNGDCLDDTRLFCDAHKEIYVVLRRLSISMLSAALRVDYTHYNSV